MEIELVPLLRTQRDLYHIPRGRERFDVYLRTMVNADASDLRLPPLVLMNPMGKDHVPVLLDALLDIDAEGVAAHAVGEASAQLVALPGKYKLGLVVTDDAAGGWTNRYTVEFTTRFESGQTLKRGWLTVVLWTSEAASVQTVREEVLMSVYRAAYIQQFGLAVTLGEMLAQEGYAMAAAASTRHAITSDEAAYTREVIKPHLNARDRPTLIACLFGDAAASSLGYSPLGLSERAGLALAQHDARLKLPGPS